MRKKIFCVILCFSMIASMISWVFAYGTEEQTTGDISVGTLKFFHQNIVGSQTPYSGNDLLETKISTIPDVLMGMRINKPVFKVTIPITATASASATLKAVQYGKSGKALSTYSEEVTINKGASEKVISFSHVRNVKSIKVFLNDEYIGGIDDEVKYTSSVSLLEYPDDYQIYQRDENDKAVISISGLCESGAAVTGTKLTANGVNINIESDTDISNAVLIAAQYSDNALVKLIEYPVATVNKQASVSLENDFLNCNVKVMLWNNLNEMVPLAASIETYVAQTEETETVRAEFYAAGTSNLIQTAEANFVAGQEFKNSQKIFVGLFDAKIYSPTGLVKTITNFGVGDIWVAAGQSNMTDMGAITDNFNYASDDPIIEGMHIIYPENTTWSQMSHPAGEGRFFKTGIRTSPVTSFARTLVQELNVPIGIVQSSVGGTNIYQWAKGIKSGDANDGYLINAMESCFDNMPSTRIRGIIWYQGENDAISENYAYNYENLQTEIFRQFREFFGDENLPIITTQLNDANQDSTSSLGYYDAWSYVKDVQRRYPENHGNTYVVGTNGLDLGDTIHNSAKSNLTLGNSWARMTLNKVYGKADVVCEHPTIDTATVTGTNTIRLTFKNVGANGLYARTDTKRIGITNSLYTIQLGDLTKEFVVRQGGNKKITSSNTGTGTTLTITNATIENNNEVVLTTKEELSGIVAVDCCYGKRFAPSLTDKDTGWSVLAFYNVIASFENAIEAEPAVEYAAEDTALLSQTASVSSDEIMYLNYYSNANAYPIMKFDISNVDISKVQSVSLQVYTTNIDKDRTGNITISKIDTDWDNTATYTSTTYSSLNPATIKTINTSTAALLPVGNYSNIDITDYVKANGVGILGIGLSCDYAAVTTIAGIDSLYPPKLVIQSGHIAEITVTDGTNPVASLDVTIAGTGSTIYNTKTFTTDASGKISAILTSGSYKATTALGTYKSAQTSFTVNGTDTTTSITVEKNLQIPNEVVISGGQTASLSTTTTKSLKSFTATLYDNSGVEINGASWQWTITPNSKATVTDGVVTINSSAAAGDILTLTASATYNDQTVSNAVSISIVDTLSYTFGNQFVLTKPFTTANVTDIAIADTGMAVTTSGSNYTNVAIINSSTRSNAGYYPYGTGLTGTNYYLFLGAGGNGTSTFTVTLPEAVQSGMYITIKYAKPYATNNGTTNRSAGNAMTMTIGTQTIDVQTNCAYDTWYTDTINVSTDVSAITFLAGKWSALAIESIQISSGIIQ
ncbi:MAG: hypothetical protein N2171_08390 [Clostridia bacterium]|nr:hypothetical protein [Clostridia bacterium]